MRFRKLRIAWLAGCGIACLLLVVLWVRSYFARERLDVIESVCSSWQGRIWMYRIPIHLPGVNPDDIRVDLDESQIIEPSAGLFGFYARWTTSTDWIVRSPHWFWVWSFGILAAAPWFRWRFTLRTLLIATTLVAVVLGIIVWSLR